MDTLLQDLRYAARTLARSRGFTLAAVATLALGIGANASVFGAIHGLFLAPLPYPHADRMLFVWGHRTTSTHPQLPVSLPVALDVHRRTRSFDAVAAWTSLPDTRFSLTGAGEPVDVQYAVVTAELIPLLGGRLVAGRGLLAEDDSLGAARVALIGERLWRDRFGASSATLGRAITLDGVPYDVVGVVAEDFRFVEYPRAPEIWLPLGSDPFGDRRFAPAAAMGVIARLRPGVTLDAARAELAALATAIGEAFPPLRDWTLVAEPFREQLAGGQRRLVLALMGAAGLVLLVACTNIAGLLLARGTRRATELGVRSALGASGSRLLRLVLTESALLAALGGAAGILVLQWTPALMVRLAAGESSLFQPWRLSAADLGPTAATVAFGLGLALLTGVLMGVVPALMAQRGAALAEASRSAARVTRPTHVRSALVALQVALCFALLVGAGLFVRSFERLSAIDPGFAPAGAAAVDLALPRARYDTPLRRAQFYDEILTQLEAMPGVSAAGAGQQLPLAGPLPSTDIRIAGEPAPEPGREPRAEYQSVSAAWFAAVGAGIEAGRAFAAGEGMGAPRVALINQAMARTYFAGRNPLGARVALSHEALRFPGPNQPPVLDFPAAYRHIVGVVGDVRQGALDAPAAPTIYLPLNQAPPAQVTLVVRGEAGPAALLEAARRAVRTVDATQPVTAPRSLQSVADAAAGESRLRALLLSGFGLMALLLAAIGIFGVVSHEVGLRTRELGIRLALGARPDSLVRETVRHGLVPVMFGFALGVPAAAIGALAIGRLLYEVAPLDPWTFTAVAALLLLAAAAASWVPARRVARVDPTVAIRTD